MDDWQAWCLDHALSEQDDGQWSAFEVAILVSRQCGKGSILEARQLAGLYLLGERLQVHTAHEFKTCFEHFLRVVNLIEGCPDLDKRVQRIRRGAGEQAIELRTGERLRFLARSAGSGKGFSGDAVYLDEAFALTPAMMGALLPTLSARANPQLWYTSSAPYERSAVLHSVRARGHDGGSSRLFFAEWGLERGCEIEDRDNWYVTNPALGIRITEEFVAAELDAMKAMPDEFARERLGVPDPLLGSTVGPIDLIRWSELADKDSRISGEVSTAIDVSPDLKWATVAAAGVRSDGEFHVEIARRQPGTEWIVPFAAANPEFGPYRVAGSSPAGFLLPLLAEAGVWTTDVSVGDVTQATARLITQVDDGTLHHLGSNEIAAALSNATVVQRGDVQAWSRVKSSGDISALVAATIAVGGMRSDVDPIIRF